MPRMPRMRVPRMRVQAQWSVGAGVGASAGAGVSVGVVWSVRTHPMAAKKAQS